MTATILTGDVIEQLRTLPDNSVQCVVTSPPYYGLRDYGTATWEGGDAECDHKQGRNGSGRADGIVDERGQRNRDGVGSMGGDCAKCGARRIDNQIGLERTPELYVARMVEVFREVRRILREDGVCWLNLGDSYNGSGGAGGDYAAGGLKDGQPRYPGRNIDNLKPKDLIGIPWRVAFALQADGWWLRSDIIWHKPNPMPESVTDRPTKAHEYVFLLTKAARYYYDAEAIKEAQVCDESTFYAKLIKQPHKGQSGKDDVNDRHTTAGFQNATYNPAGRNARSVWTIATQPYPEAHFATFPEELPRRCIMAGTSAHGCCPECGAPWGRVVEREGETNRQKADRLGFSAKNPVNQGINCAGGHGDGSNRLTTTIGWRPTCTCQLDPDTATQVPCTVLDPFAGSGTTLAVALALGRNAIGIELNPEYVRLAERRLAGVTPALFGV